MTETQKAAMQQALEALEWISDCYVGDDDDAGECASCHQRSHKPHAPDCKKNNAITALRAAPAEPEPEPVADEVKAQALDALNRMQSIFMMPDGRHPRDVLRAFIQLVSTPPARRPLTPAQEAAPELLEALREVLDIAESLADATHVNRGERAALRSAAKIIAKAGGTR